MLRKLSHKRVILFLILAYAVMTIGMCLDQTNIMMDSDFYSNSISSSNINHLNRPSALSDMMQTSPEAACLKDANYNTIQNYSIYYGKNPLSEKICNHFLSFLPILADIIPVNHYSILADSYKQFIHQSQNIIICYIHQQDGKKSSILH